MKNTQPFEIKRLILLCSGLLLLLISISGCNKAQTRPYPVVYKVTPTTQRRGALTSKHGPNNHNNALFSANGKKNSVKGKALTSDTATAGTNRQWYPNGALASSDSLISRYYHIGPGDTLNIKVYQLEQVGKITNLHLKVSQDGQINMPVLHTLTVAGMTTGQLRSELLHRLGSKYIRNPKVDVSIENYGSKIVMLLGYVGKPGPLALHADTEPLMDVISRAGGIKPGAAPYLEIIRGGFAVGPDLSMAGNTSRTSKPVLHHDIVPIVKLFADNKARQVNPLIYPGDVIRIRPASEGNIFMSGEFNRPGVKPFQRPLTILQAVACAGGTTKIAAENKCRIIRQMPDGNEREIKVDLNKVLKGKQPNILLARNDTIIVPVDPVDKFFNDIASLFHAGIDTGVRVTYDAGQDMGMPTGYGSY